MLWNPKWFPGTNLQDINLDWILKKVSALRGGRAGQYLYKKSDKDFDFGWKTGGGGGGGTSDYLDLDNKPSINNVELVGNKTASDLGLAASSDIPEIPVQSVNGKTGAVVLSASDVGAYVKPESGIPKTDLSSAVQTSLDKADTAYTKPESGIPKTDLSSAVQTSLDKADTALQAVPPSYRTATAQDAIDAVQNTQIDARAKTNEIAIVINGKRPGRNATAGQYVIVRNSTISGISDGLYVVNTGYTLSPSVDVTAASLSAVNIGGLNFLLSKIEDSGWINLTLTSSFTLYNTTTAKARYRKIGKLVEVQGTIKPTAELTNGGDSTAIATLPTGYRPANDSRIFICQGTSSNRWTLTINANGVINISRYGVAEFITVPTNAWLPFDVMFFVD